MKARLTLKVRAGAKKTEFTGMHGHAWKLQVAAPPVDGRANAEIVRFLSQIAGVPKASLRILTGLSSSTKIIEVEGLDSAQFERAILESHGPRPDSSRTAPRQD
jgi:uncharacterized protein (TIGR00251 family)